MERRIVCITKPGGTQNPHEAITHYGWTSGEDGRATVENRKAMVDWVKAGGQAYVKSGFLKAYCRVLKSRAGTEFLQTYSDGQPSDNLLHLRACNIGR